MSKHSEAQIVEIEERLRQAMLTSNVTELDALIAPGLIFTNHLGQLVSKQQDLDMHRSGIFQLTALTPAEQKIQLHEGFAIVSVQMHLLGSYDGTAVDEQIRFTRVWATSSTGSLQIMAGHGSVVAA
ncbi:MAG: nuclear transport factor 2 family protein [Cyanobacteria bacterium J06638_28]